MTNQMRNDTTVMNVESAGTELPDELPFHDGERGVQRRVGVEAIAASVARHGVRSAMPQVHRQFLAELPFLVVGGMDADGQPWATLRVGAPGFVTTPDAQTLELAPSALPGDPLEGSWKPGSAFAGLGIEPWTRRRNRVNGVVASVVTGVNGDALRVAVTQSFGNCPKYIQAREPIWHAQAATVREARTSDALTELDRVTIAGADTVFIASASAARPSGIGAGADVSHRGGPPGFVRIEDARTLTMPDFSGNRLFNTLGNLTSYPRAGLLFVDFTSGDLLYLAARATIDYDTVAIAEFAGAERLIRLEITEVRRTPAVVPFTWSAVELSPQIVRLALARRAPDRVTP